MSDPLQSSQAVVVFGGQVPFRAMEAAVVYQQGLAREVWVTQGVPTEEDIATAALGIDRPADHTYSVKVLQHAGVPNEAIRVLWNSLVGAHPQAIVRYTPRDPFEPEHWWQTTTDAMAVSREWFGLLNAWAGFPVPSARAHSPN